MLHNLKKLDGLAIGATDGPIGKVKDVYFGANRAIRGRCSIVSAPAPMTPTRATCGRRPTGMPTPIRI
jgi:hypothetical protein